MDINSIASGVSYVGVDDRQKVLFENLWPIPNGVSYNSYLVEGSLHRALIDGVERSELSELVDHIHRQGTDATLDYLVVNHMEPDHSGAIPDLMRIFPQMKLVGNRCTLEMVAGFYGISSERTLEVSDGQTLDLGGKTLQFFLTPMVHWPETMMTRLAEDGILFSGDAFGGFGALNGSPLDDRPDVDLYFNEIYRYYGCIVAKYGKFVQMALKKVGGLPIRTICPTHSLVWQKHLAEVIAMYDRLSSWKSEDGTVIIYGSMYGNTRAMADYIATQVSARTSAPVRVHKASYNNMADILADCVRYRNIVVGSPTYSMELFPVLEALMRALQVREIKNKRMCAFTSYAWAPNVAMKRFEDYAAAIGLPILAKAQMRQHRFEDCRADLDAIVVALTE